MTNDSPPLYLDIELQQAHFTAVGRHFLKFIVKGCEEKRREVKLYINKSTTTLREWEHTTEPCLQSDLDVPLQFADSMVTFFLPSGFANDDVIFIAEAYHLSDENPLEEGTKCGEAVFTVYPRVMSFFPTKIPSLSEVHDGVELYHLPMQLVVTNELEREGMTVSVAVLKMNLTLRGAETEDPTSHREPSPQQAQTKNSHKQYSLKSERLKKKKDQMRKKAISTGSTESETEATSSGDSIDYEYDTTGLGMESHDRYPFSEGDEDIVYSASCNSENDISSNSISPYLSRQHDAGSLANFLPSFEYLPRVSSSISLYLNNRVAPDHALAYERHGNALMEGASSPHAQAHAKGKQASRAAKKQIAKAVVAEYTKNVAAGGSGKQPSCEMSRVSMAPGTFVDYQEKVHVKGRRQDKEKRKREKKGLLRRLTDGEKEAVYDKMKEPKITGIIGGDQISQVDIDIERDYLNETIGRRHRLAFNAEDARKRSVRQQQRKIGQERKSGKTHRKQKGEPKRRPVSTPDDVGIPGPSSAYQPDSVPATPATSSGLRTIPDPPLGSLCSSVHPRHLCGSYVAREGYCEVAVLVHAALGLPAKSDGRPAQPYVTGKSKKDRDRKLQAQSVTHASIQPTHSPTWDELLLIEFTHDEARQEEIFLSIADHPSKELLVEYRIPVSHLKPCHQYHLELVQPNEDLNSDSRFYITLIVKEDKLNAKDERTVKMFGLEMLLRGLECPVANQLGPLIAAVRIVPDWRQYKDAMLAAHPSPAGVTMTTINFPSPHPTSFSVAGTSLTYGSPQVTVCGEPQDQPQWNQMLFFPGDQTSLFSATAALVVEYYAASLAISTITWQLSNPIGYSHHSLDQFLFSNLQQENAKLGLRLDALPVEGSRLKTTVGATASIGIVLRLITNQRPDVLVSASHLSSLPAFRTGPVPGPVTSHHPPAQHIQTTDQNPYGLPPLDAVKSILPQFHSVYSAPSPSPVKGYQPLPLQVLQQPTSGDAVRDITSLSNIPPELRNTMDMRTLALLDYQMKEVDRYRTAMRKLATDLLHLKQEGSRLEEANSRLRRELNQHDEISRLMIGSDDLDNVTQGELIQKLVLLKKKLSDESTKRQQLQQRTQSLQNELIKKNEKEKERIKLQEAHESQQALLQRMQGKVQKYKALQETCKKQEKVILELERLLSQEGKDATAVGEERHLSRIFSNENAQIRAELMRYKEMLEAAESKRDAKRGSPTLHSNGTMGDSERLELYQKLDRAEGRILGLEKQVTENARKWAKEKADLQMRLNEMVLAQQLGFKSSFSTHDLRNISDSPMVSSPKRSYSGPRRPTPKLDPLERR